MLAASYEAKACGVRTAMGGTQARRLCPRAVIVSPRMPAYSEASKAVFQVFEETAPLVEGLSIDEAFLDVRGLGHISGSPIEIAMQLRRRIKQRVGLPITVGIARTKFLAKVASGLVRGIPYVATAVGAGLTTYQDMQQGESWYHAAADGAVSNGAALGTGAAVGAGATLLFGGSLVAVGGGVLVGGVLAVGVGDFVHNVFQENWQADWHKDGVVDGTVHGVADSYDKTRHDLAHMWDDLF